MAYAGVKHHAKKIKAAFWRGAPKGMNKIVSIKVEIGRSMRQRLPLFVGGKSKFRSLGPGYAARACITGSGRTNRKGGLRCTYAEGRSPTLAFKAAVRKLMKKTK